MLLLLGWSFLRGVAFALGLKARDGRGGSLGAAKAEGSVFAGHWQPLLAWLRV